MDKENFSAFPNVEPLARSSSFRIRRQSANDLGAIRSFARSGGQFLKNPGTVPEFFACLLGTVPEYVHVFGRVFMCLLLRQTFRFNQRRDE
jgi:hypothetical protein